MPAQRALSGSQPRSASWPETWGSAIYNSTVNCDRYWIQFFLWIPAAARFLNIWHPAMRLLFEFQFVEQINTAFAAGLGFDLPLAKNVITQQKQTAAGKE